MRYQQAIDGDWIRPKRTGYKVACCDCGLVHRFNFSVINGVFRFQAFRDNRATAAKRRKRQKAR